MQTLWWLHNKILRYFHKKRFSVFWAVSCVFAVKVRKKYYDLKKNFFLNRKSAKKPRISRWFWIRWKSFEKMYQKKLLAKTWQKNALFSLLLMFVKLVLLITFFWCIFFPTFSTDSKSVWNSAFFDTFFDFSKNFFLGHISTFFELWLQMRRKRLKKSKNVFCKCFLDFNFAHIKGSVFFIF